MLTYEGLKTLPKNVAGPSYDVRKVTSGIVHFGVGNFFRAHLGYYVDRVLALPGHEGWGITGVGLRSGDRSEKKAEEFRAQEGLYSLTEIAASGATQIRVMGGLRDYLQAPDEPEKVLALLADKATKIISMTITEGGYNIDETTGEFRLTHPEVKEDLADPQHPKTVFGYVVEGLRRRREAGHGGLTVMSCDNLRHNGDVSRKAFVGYARAVDAELAQWIEQNVTFPNAMVDRITPSVSSEGKAKLNERSGLDDLQPLISEDFIQWVIEDKFAAGRPAFEKVGVEFSDQVSAYEHAKIRMLNSSHLILSAAGMLLGLKLVDQVLAEQRVHKFVDLVLEKDVIPTLKAPPGVDLHKYKATLLSRFSNKAMADQVARIASDATSKAQVFWTETVRAVLGEGRDRSRLVYCMALLLELLRGKTEKGETIKLEEPFLNAEQLKIAASDDVKASISLPAFDTWRDLLTPEIEQEIAQARDVIRQKGVLASLPV
ncbi:mannitol dehydrogenase family protein [Bombella saccharophila]|uniref:Mannitol dehydrogenase family protein n=1 Tax=Bombella saccharophila TaxID=2967338 RepID=A0ABT3W8B0_9PROT|nr:mannitol dehydrogenase family protein [Bombella saccharophila]MCX5614629.1 mannitol dehydrogenase family protein [Bombella saccharophila]PHI96748.1 polyol:NADP oxidoreductase [Parasaccharibacter apium]